MEHNAVPCVVVNLRDETTLCETHRQWREGRQLHSTQRRRFLESRMTCCQPEQGAAGLIGQRPARKACFKARLRRVGAEPHPTELVSWKTPGSFRLVCCVWRHTLVSSVNLLLSSSVGKYIHIWRRHIGVVGRTRVFVSL